MSITSLSNIVKHNSVEHNMVEQKLLEVEDLSFDINGYRLMNNISFCLSRGELCHLFGKNGAGKTSLLMLLHQSIQLSSSENIKWQQNLKYASLLGQSFFWQQFTVLENIRWYCLFHQIDSSETKLTQLIDQFQLRYLLNEPVAHLSEGEKQRLAWLCLVAHQSDVWLLDEPFNQLDTDRVKFCLELLQDFLNQGGGVVIATHIYVEALPISEVLNLSVIRERHD